MKLKTLSRINRAVEVVLALLLLPLAIVGDVLDWLIKPFAWVCGDMQSAIQKRVGNRLLLMADEVLYVIEEMKHIGPTVTDMEVNLTLSMEYQALFVPENRDPTSQILAMIMGKEYTTYGPITSAMLEEIEKIEKIEKRL